MSLLHVRRGAGQAAQRRASACTWSPTRSSTWPDAAPNWAARRRCSRSVTAPRRGGRRRSSGLTNAATTRRLDYVRAMSIRVLEETGLLPHLNPGVMSWSELSRLKPVAPSMGMMLETTSRRLYEIKGMAHYGSPDKDPAVRLRTLTDAGRSVDPVHHRTFGGHRREPDRARRDAACDPQVAQGVRARTGSDRSELQGQAHHGDAVGARRRHRRLRRHDRGCTAGARSEDADPGAAESGVAQRMSRADRRRTRRLGRGVAADARPCESGTAMARVGRARRRHRARPVTNWCNGSPPTRPTCWAAPRGSTHECADMSRRSPTRTPAMPAT